jgi:hypothetical protein
VILSVGRFTIGFAMSSVIQLDEWRRRRDPPDAGEERLAAAVERLDRMLADRGWDRRPAPAWLVTDLLAIQGCIAMGLTAEAAQRVERLIDRSERRRRRAGPE